jgi:hypothetical protein
MGKKLMTTLATAGLMLGLAFPASAPALANGAGQQGNEHKEKRERHPEIREAMRALQHAKQELTKEAANDFGGHKAQAIRNIDEAIEHLQQALQSDKH